MVVCNDTVAHSDWVKSIGKIQLNRIDCEMSTLKFETCNTCHYSFVHTADNVILTQKWTHKMKFIDPIDSLQIDQNRKQKPIFRLKRKAYRKYRPYWIENELDSNGIHSINSMLIFPKGDRYICICVTHNNKWPIHYPCHRHFIIRASVECNTKKMSTNFSMQYLFRYSHNFHNQFSLFFGLFLNFNENVSVFSLNFGYGPIQFTKFICLAINYFTFWSINTTAAVCGVYGTFSLVWRPSAEWCDEYYVQKLFRLNFPCSHQIFVSCVFPLSLGLFRSVMLSPELSERRLSVSIAAALCMCIAIYTRLIYVYSDGFAVRRSIESN